MADCPAPTLSVPDLTCASNLETWAVGLVAEVQAAINYLVGCIGDVALPQCDICALKDDLLDCPLSPQMIDFNGISYGDDAGQGVLPYPPNLANYDFRTGTGTATPVFGDFGEWRSTALVFATPFATQCLWVGITPETDTGCVVLPGGGAPPSGVGINGTNCVYVQNLAVTGCTVWIYKESPGKECNVTFRYCAVGI